MTAGLPPPPWLTILNSPPAMESTKVLLGYGCSRRPAEHIRTMFSAKEAHRVLDDERLRCYTGLDERFIFSEPMFIASVDQYSLDREVAEETLLQFNFQS